MNSTPNYGYDTQISAIGAIDRDLRRVEDKTDANAAALGHHAERITRSEEKIKCLSKARCDAYSKCETDRLLDGKVDKKDGFGLISDSCLNQICTNKGDISLLEQSIRELRERNERLEEELKNKASIKQAEKHSLEIMEDFEYYFNSYYSKNQFGEVIVYVSLKVKEGRNIPTRTVVATLPEGFRPASTLEVPCVFGTEEEGYTSGTILVDVDGMIRIYFHGYPKLQAVIGNSIIFHADR